jgi:hypothetical protein
MPRFLSKYEIVRDYIALLTPETREKWMRSGCEELLKFHWGIASWIRSHYRLWHPENPYSRKGYRADDVSMQIIEKVWNELHGKTKPS